MMEHRDALIRMTKGWLTESRNEAIRQMPSQVAATACETAAKAGLVDLAAYLRRDPAAHGDAQMVVSAYTAFHAVLGYRLANALNTYSLIAARVMSEEVKVRTVIEIHPSAQIGPGFVLDHGVGTVIGETCQIGADCTVLNHVVLGARGVASNPGGQRHPILGNRVQVGSHVSILGPVVIGDDAFVGARCLVTRNIPPKSRVTAQIKSIVTGGSAQPMLQIAGFLLTNEQPTKLCVFGSQLSCVESIHANGCIPINFTVQSDQVLLVENKPATFLRLGLCNGETVDLYLPTAKSASNDNAGSRKIA